MREAKGLERGDTREDATDGHTDEPALTEDIDPEAADALQRVREVDLVRLAEDPALFLGHQCEPEPLAVLRREWGRVDRDEVAVDAQIRRTTGPDVDVRCHVLRARSEQ